MYSRWPGYGLGTWMEIDLGAPRKVGKIELVPWAASANWMSVGSSIGLFTASDRGGANSCGPASWMIATSANVPLTFSVSAADFATPTASPTTVAAPLPPPAGLDMYAGKHHFVPCLYEDLAEEVVWVGNSDVPVGDFTANELGVTRHKARTQAPFNMYVRL